MKKITFLLFAVAIVLSSCSKDNSEDVINSTYFSYNFEGDNYRKDTITTFVDNLIEGQFNLNLQSDDSDLLIIVDDFSGTTGSYNASYANLGVPLGNFYGSGTVEITEVNTKDEYVVGSFSLTVSPLGISNEYAVTDGAFNLRYNEF